MANEYNEFMSAICSQTRPLGSDRLEFHQRLSVEASFLRRANREK